MPAELMACPQALAHPQPSYTHTHTHTTTHPTIHTYSAQQAFSVVCKRKVTASGQRAWQCLRERVFEYFHVGYTNFMHLLFCISKPAD